MKHLLVLITLLTISFALKGESPESDSPEGESNAVKQTQRDLDKVDEQIANQQVKSANDPVALHEALKRDYTKQK